MSLKTTSWGYWVKQMKDTTTRMAYICHTKRHCKKSVSFYIMANHLHFIFVNSMQDQNIKDKTMQIIKSDNSFNTILFVALVPMEIDRNGDMITEAEITKTAHDFVRNLSKKKVNVDHESDTDIATAEFVESFVAPVEINVWLETIPKGSWVVGIKFDDDTYSAIQNGDFVGISIEGVGIKEEIA